MARRASRRAATCVSGPMLYDTLGNLSTHFVDFWRGEMWGIWGQAWEACPGANPVANPSTSVPGVLPSVPGVKGKTKKTAEVAEDAEEARSS